MDVLCLVEGEEFYEDALEYQPTTPPALLALPLEIRNKIYCYTLASTTGYVLIISSAIQPQGAQTRYEAILDERQSFSLARTEAEARHKVEMYPNTLSPTFLRTCKQVYVEAAPYLYASNVIVLPTGLLTTPCRPFPAHFSHTLRHVWIDSKFWQKKDDIDLQSLDDTLKKLCSWANKVESRGNSLLESITLSIAPDQTKLVDVVMHSLTESTVMFSQFLKLLGDDNARWLVQDHPSILASNLSSSKDLERRRNTGRKMVVRRLELSGIYLFAKQLPSVLQPAIEKLRDAFGGELWFDPGWCAPVMCWQDGKETWPLFKHNLEGDAI